MIFATGLAAISTFIIVASSIQLQNAFGASAEAVEAWDKTDTLEAKLLGAYGYLVRIGRSGSSSSFDGHLLFKLLGCCSFPPIWSFTADIGFGLILLTSREIA